MGYGDSMQWTEVRYGRRGRRFREGGGYAGSGDRLRTGSRGMDSAFPVGWRRGPIANIMSNPPVPPRDFSTAARSVRPPRGDGFRPRSYADVVRQAAPRQFRDRSFLHNDNVLPTARRRDVRGTRQQQTPPTDPLFSGQVPHQQRDKGIWLMYGTSGRAGRVLQNGSVLPESQARFLEEVVELSSEPASSVVRDGPPSCSQQGTRSVPSGPGQEPQVLLSTAAADGGATPTEGQGDLVDVRDKREGRRVLQNGSVLPESQARFLEEVVELSSEPASSVVRDGPPSCSQQGTRSVPSGPGQEPQVLLSTAAADGGATPTEGQGDLVDVRDKREGRRVLQNGWCFRSPRPGSWRKWWSFLLSPPLLWCVTDLLRVVSREPGLFRLARDKNHRYFFPQLLLTEVRPESRVGGRHRLEGGFGGYDDRPSAGDATDWGCARGGVGFPWSDSTLS
ncbi:hypothetical protein Q5P01_014246 [Channa striata]|uniref:Uncharacterized protein n=1 Tax=Channa striata TaxID=64152 RepID=A0AA88MLV5_CHASR|nr:hypothetical protein Q5P01_014246 [Channa striata]